MKTSTKKRIETRFHELLVKDCQGLATPAEKAKLDRYERLRRGDMNHSERRQCARMDYDYQQLMKLFGKVERLQREQLGLAPSLP